MRLTACLLPILLIVSWFTLLPGVEVMASGTLVAPYDLLNNDGVSTNGVTHSVGFGLPANSQVLGSDDFILIELSPAFTNVATATFMTGHYTGTPVFDIDGNTISVTGVVVLPGGSVTVEGITATNPPVKSQYTVTITVADDAGGSIIQNVANVQATSSGASVTVSASLEAPVATLQISGFAGPSTFITFTENGSVIGTDAASGAGIFSQIFYGLDPDTHSISMFGVDQSSRTTSPVFVSVYTPIYQQTDVTNIVMSPTIEIDNTTITQGDDLVANGLAVPDGDLTLFTEFPLSSYTTSADSSGVWGYTITDTATYNPGDHRIYSLVQTGSLQSLVSNSLSFTVLSTGGGTPSPPSCDISQGDLDCDSDTDLSDFSILMYYWGSTSPLADINSDGYVDLTDFSILMYYWG